MKALSLWEPWATLVRRGLKLYETRNWPLPAALVEQPLGIHAAKQKFVPAAWPDSFRRQLSADDVHEPFPYGCMLCVVHPGRSVTTKALKELLITKSERLAESAVTDQFLESIVSRYEREFVYGNYADMDPDGKQRWATPLKDIRVLPEPIPVIGRQGIFDWPEGDALYADLW